MRRARDWPPNSPGTVNAWLLLVTDRAPVWRDPLLELKDHPPTWAEPHPTFFYPDPLGFWAEVRRWSVELLRIMEPQWGRIEALSVTALIHSAEDADRVARALVACWPRMVLFFDDVSFAASGLDFARDVHHITDPHRPGQVFEGFWGHGPDGMTVGKAPQHPTTHKLYRADEMLAFLRSAPAPKDE